MGDIARFVYFTTFRRRCQEGGVGFEDETVEEFRGKGSITIEIGKSGDAVETEVETLVKRAVEVGF